MDADFAGPWPHEDKPDSTCVKSQTGFVTCITNCPVIWQSELQSEIASSTTEAEYMALSMAMRSVIPFLNVARAIKAHLGLDDSQSTFKVNVWEDNSTCHTLANLEPGQMTPRTKHCTINLHWFCSQLEPNNVKIKKNRCAASRHLHKRAPEEQVSEDWKIVVQMVSGTVLL